MRTGVAYMGHYNPRHIEVDIREMKGLQIDEVLVAVQENDFAYFPGKAESTSKIAKEHGMRPVAIFWGALNLFGGGRSSQFLLEYPEGLQVGRDGAHRAEGCYVNQACVGRVKEMIDVVAGLGFEGYFVDEPAPLRDCYCNSCCNAYIELNDADLLSASDAEKETFRQGCVVEYVQRIADYCKCNYPKMETMTCLTPEDKQMWQKTSEIANLDNLGTDLYWVNNNNDVEGMVPVIKELDGICKAKGKRHHAWLQCWGVEKGREQRILEQGKILIREQPDSLYVWAWQGQVGTNEACDDPGVAWRYASEVFKMAKE